jgi:integrase
MSELQQPLNIQYYPAYLSEGKIWYITYYAYNPYTDKLQMKRIKVNRIKSIPERRKFCRKLIKEINNKLESGWNPFIENAQAKHFHSVISAIEVYKKTKYKELEENSIRSYTSFLKKLQEYVEGIDKEMYCINFNKRVASDFMLKIKEDPKIGNRTYNNNLAFYRTFFEWMESVNYISDNPFKGLKKIPKRKTKKVRTSFERDELKKLVEHLKIVHPRFLAACMLMYYCFLRNEDLCNLTPEHFDLKNKLIYIHANETKNDNDSYRVIPKVLEKYLKVLDIENTPKNYFIFSTKNYAFEAGPKQLNSRYFSKYWSDRVRKDLNLPMNLQFYSLKDTGITNLMADGISPAFIQGQADHSSLEVTTEYIHNKTPEGFKQIRDLAKDLM